MSRFQRMHERECLGLNSMSWLSDVHPSGVFFFLSDSNISSAASVMEIGTVRDVYVFAVERF